MQIIGEWQYYTTCLLLREVKRYLATISGLNGSYRISSWFYVLDPV